VEGVAVNIVNRFRDFWRIEQRAELCVEQARQFLREVVDDSSLDQVLKAQQDEADEASGYDGWLQPEDRYEGEGRQ
jgi:hypothetical protein